MALSLGRASIMYTLHLLAGLTSTAGLLAATGGVSDSVGIRNDGNAKPLLGELVLRDRARDDDDEGECTCPSLCASSDAADSELIGSAAVDDVPAVDNDGDDDDGDELNGMSLIKCESGELTLRMAAGGGAVAGVGCDTRS
jgi:hypothetical protein